MDQVIFVAVLCQVLECIGLHEVERVPRHRTVVYARYVRKPGPVVASGCSTSPAKEIK